MELHLLCTDFGLGSLVRFICLGANIDLLSLHQYLPLRSINLSVDLEKSQHLHRVLVCAAFVLNLSLDSVLINPYLQEFITESVGMPSRVSCRVPPWTFV